METLNSLIDQYKSVYNNAKTALEAELETECEKEKIQNRYNKIWACITYSVVIIFGISMGVSEVFGENILLFSPLGVLLTIGLLSLPFTMVALGIACVLDKLKKQTTNKEELENKLKQIIAPADFPSAFDKLKKRPLEEFASVSTIPVHYCVEKTTYAGIEPVVIGNKTLRGYKGGIIKLEADDLPPVLCSIRGKNGPETESGFIYKCIFWDGPETTGQTREAEYPCISKEKFEDFPEEIYTNAVCVTLFPKFLGKNAWRFLIFNPGAYDEIKTAMETLCITVVQHIAETNAKTMLMQAIKEGSALYRPDDATLLAQDDIIACFSRKEDDGETAGPLSDVFEAAEAVLAPSMLGFNFATLTTEAQTPDIVVDSVTA